tara:strand:- start:14238 stop:14792 length:555 start_codon:yes stop_codon:yes gene_type:complete
MSDTDPIKASAINQVTQDEESESLKLEIEKKDTEIADLNDKLQHEKSEQLRLIAEMRNQKTRLDRKAALDTERAARYFITDLLPSLDGLEKAIEASKKEDASVEHIISGIEMTQSAIEKTLTQHKVEIIRPFKEVFNPDLHEALATIEADQEPNTIVQVVQTGYKLGDLLIRAAKVIVCAEKKS